MLAQPLLFFLLPPLPGTVAAGEVRWWRGWLACRQPLPHLPTHTLSLSLLGCPLARHYGRRGAAPVGHPGPTLILPWSSLGPAASGAGSGHIESRPEWLPFPLGPTTDGAARPLSAHGEPPARLSPLSSFSWPDDRQGAAGPLHSHGSRYVRLPPSPRAGVAQRRERGSRPSRPPPSPSSPSWSAAAKGAACAVPLLPLSLLLSLHLGKRLTGGADSAEGRTASGIGGRGSGGRQSAEANGAMGVDERGGEGK